MDLCLMIEGQEGVEWAHWLAIARACEEHGVGALFRSDHYLNLDGRMERGSLDAWATIAALGAVTSTLRLGTLVSPVTFRHPSELAKVVVTADWASGGRVELGLGAGWNEREHEAFGFPFPPLRERMDMLEEQLEIVHGVWREGTFSFSGSGYTLSEVDARPLPVQRPHPPLIMGGMAGPRGAALAARWADEYNTIFATVDEVVARRDAVAAACERAGREPIPFSLMTGFCAGRDREELRDRAAALVARRRPEVLRSLGSTSPPLSDMDPDLAAAADEMIADPPSGWIVGTVEEVAEQLRALRDAGVARVMLQNLLHEDLDVIELIGRELAPLVA